MDSLAYGSDFMFSDDDFASNYKNPDYLIPEENHPDYESLTGQPLTTNAWQGNEELLGATVSREANVDDDTSDYSGRVGDFFRDLVSGAQTSTDAQNAPPQSAPPQSAPPQSGSSGPSTAAMVRKYDPDIEIVYNYVVLSNKPLSYKEKNQTTPADAIEPVKALQRALGFSGADVDGKYGLKTANELGVFLTGSSSPVKVVDASIARSLRDGFSELVPASSTEVSRGSKAPVTPYVPAYQAQPVNVGPQISRAQDLMAQLGPHAVNLWGTMSAGRAAQQTALEERDKPSSVVAPQEEKTPWGLYAGIGVGAGALLAGLYIALRK